ncbi:family 16 glycosylhydrolase [Lapillicoccus sp.]|uniref:ricin-type beta-trefoil lectin domain protein n=1 Tax=Lapillicoccus sp. TaxID=1909287 RepID=UPI0025F96CB0|nr:family 16 glycosylhydrolase [Lapillicoccus sp.]
MPWRPILSALPALILFATTLTTTPPATTHSGSSSVSTSARLAGRVPRPVPLDDLPVTGLLQNRAAPTCVGVPDGGRNLTRPVLSLCVEGAAQSWTVMHPLTEGAVTAQWLCLDATHANFTDPGPTGWVVQLYSCNGTRAQTWRVTNGLIVSSLNGYCVGPSGAAIGFITCTPSGPRLWNVPSGRLVQGATQMVDDFTGTAGSAPDSSRWTEWSACSYNPSAAFGSIACGRRDSLDGDGHLVIPADPTHGSALRSTSAFTYGVFSAWLRLPSAPGYWPAFWMLNSPQNGSSVSQVGEIDAMEAYTTWPSQYHSTSHVYASGTQTNDTDHLCGGSADLSVAFHKYSVRVEPGADGRGRISYYLDDRQCGGAFTPATNPQSPWPFAPSLSRPNWMILDLAVGGADGKQVSATTPTSLLVERVEVRQLF